MSPPRQKKAPMCTYCTQVAIVRGLRATPGFEFFCATHKLIAPTQTVPLEGWE